MYHCHYVCNEECGNCNHKSILSASLYILTPWKILASLGIWIMFLTKSILKFKPYGFDYAYNGPTLLIWAWLLCISNQAIICQILMIWVYSKWVHILHISTTYVYKYKSIYQWNSRNKILNIISSNDQSIQHESDGLGFESLSGRDIFCLKNSTLSQEQPFVCWKWMLLPAQS